MPPLFRYFSSVNADAFLKRGEVLLRSLSYYRDHEEEGARADAYEGTLVHRPEGGLKMTRVASGEEVSVPYTFESTAKEDDIFIYCMSTEFSKEIAERFRVDVCIEFVEPHKFLARFRASVALRRRINVDELVHGPVHYYEPHEAPIVDWALPEKIAMRKPKRFEWQKEYRIVVPRGNAFQVENVNVKLVPLGHQRQPGSTQHPKEMLKLGNLRKLCKVHTL